MSITERYILQASSRQSMVRRAIAIATAWLVLAVLIMVAYFASFAWYASTDLIARTYPTPYNDFLWGMVHGFYLLPSFILSLFDPSVNIYQTPNAGKWYNLGFIAGIVGLNILVKFAKAVNRWWKARRRSRDRL